MIINSYQNSALIKPKGIAEKGTASFQAKQANNVSFQGVIDPNTLKGFQKWGVKLANKIPNTFYEGKTLNYIADLAKNYPGLFEALAALGVTCTIRPVSIMALPGAKTEDKQYAAVKSIASGLVGYGLSLALYKPIGDVMKKLGKGELNHLLKKPFPYKTGSAQFDTFSFVVNYGSKFILALPTAVATFKAIPWLMNKIFPNRKKKPMDNYNPPIAAAQLNDRQQVVFNSFMQLSKTKGVS